jgi:ribonuclease HI
VNVDGALDVASGEDGIGVVIRDAKGEVQLSAWKYVDHSIRAEEVEALACKEGMELATK